MAGRTKKEGARATRSLRSLVVTDVRLRSRKLVTQVSLAINNRCSLATQVHFHFFCSRESTQVNSYQ